MKNNIFKHLFLALTLVLGLTSCEDRDIITIDNVNSPIVMDLSASSLVLDSNFPSNPALTVSWEPATATVPVEMKYKVQISGTEDFAQKIDLATKDKSQTVASFTTQEMNEAAKKIGLVPYEAQNMHFRVISFLGVDDMMQQSETTSLLVTPYLASPTYDYEDLYLVGDATAGGWDNLADNFNLLPLLKTAEAGKYTFTGLFKVGGFKMIKVKGSWDAQVGMGAAEGTLSTDGGSGDIKILTEGYYKLTVDTGALTYSIEPVTVSSPTYTSISIIGSVNGDWDTDTELTQSTFDPHMWSKAAVSLNGGEFKFRANNAWDTSWGTNSEFFGTATTNGANIPLTSEWIYDVYFNDATGVYSLIPVK